MASGLETNLIASIIADLQEPKNVEDIYKTICSKHKTRTGKILHYMLFLLSNDVLSLKEKHIAIIVYLQLCDETKDATHRQLLWNLEKARENDNARMLIYEMIVLKSIEKVK